MKVKVKRKVAEFLENTSSIVSINKNRYLYMPYWMKSTSDPTIFDQLNWDELPKELQNFIQSMREGEKP